MNQGIQMTSRSVKIFEIRIPVEKIALLSNQDRYTYYMLGHMFNELMCLQKLIGFSMPKHTDYRPARIRPELSQTMFLFRIACSKIWEAMIKLRRDEMNKPLVQVIFPKMDSGAQRWKELNEAVKSAAWLKGLRDGVGFHFPTYKDWTPFITPTAAWVDDVIFVGDKTGNTFYDASDNLVQSWMFGLTGDENIELTVNPMINQMIDLLRIMTGFLEEAIGTFISEVVLEPNDTCNPIGKVVAPEHERVTIPFWTAMKSPVATSLTPSPA
jgi:hypothetical protein